MISNRQVPHSNYEHLHSKPAALLLLKLQGVDEWLVNGLDHELSAVHALAGDDVINVRLDLLSADVGTGLPQAGRVALLLRGESVAGLGGLGGSSQLLLQLL